MNTKSIKAFLAILCLTFIFQTSLFAQANAPLRRPISPQQPMWLIHIDTWNYADPQKIIDLIPEDIRPYVVMNISLSISHDVATSRFKVAEYGYEIAKSWLRVCAQNQMWATVQHSSGGYAQFSDFDLSVYEELFRDYPNLIGFSYAEQFWGFDDPGDKLSPKWIDRMTHFSNLLKVCNKYGGYLVVSWCGNQWSPSINPIAMMKRSPAFAASCEKYTDNYILCEKYTQQSFQSDMESICLGSYLSGYSGNYGTRYDDTGWTDTTGENKNFTMATAGAVHLEHMMLTGATVIDGPELIWTQCFRETNRVSTTDGYSMRNWETYPQFNNVSVDIFRKVLDGTIRIPSRQEVIDRTKYVIVNDVNSGNVNDIYSSPQTLFEGLYRMNGDGNYENNKTFFKKTGRYPTIPTVYNLDDEIANSFDFQIKRSDYSSRWSTVSTKVNELNKLFPEEYTGDLYAGRHENGWVIYNPYKTGQTASASIPFKFSTCDSVYLDYSQYTASVMKEYADKVTFYLSNYDNVISTALKTDVIKIYGSTNKPTYTHNDRGNHQASTLAESWTDGVFTLTVKHNGPIDITVNCDGTATGRSTSFTQATVLEPSKPPIYTGPRQYEAECFDYKNITNITTGGQNGSIRNYTGQGYLELGTSSTASVRDTVYALRSGIYQLITRYSVVGSDVNHLDLYVNGSKVATPVFTKTTTTSEWNINTQNVELKAGKNVIIYKANKSGTRNIYLDNIVIERSDNGVYNFSNDTPSPTSTTPPASFVNVQSGTAGVVSFTDSNNKTSNCFKTYSAGSKNGTGVANLDLFPYTAADYSIVWKEYYGTSGGKKGMLLRGTGENGSCSYAEGLKQGYLFIAQNNADNTVTLKPYVATPNGITEKTSFTTSFKIMPDQPCWFRARAVGNQMKFECSTDSLNWVGGTATAFTDDLYKTGSTQLVWGVASDNFSWTMDDIAYKEGFISVSRLSMDSFSYIQDDASSASQLFKVSGKSMTDDIKIEAPQGFEISLSAETGYTASITLKPEAENIQNTTIYVRLKAGLNIGTYEGILNISSNGTTGTSLTLNGRVYPQPISRVYNFTTDVASNKAQTPPSLYTTIGKGNSATAGVVSYTDSKSVTSNMLKPYTSGQRNATGAINLERFSKTATDYSVTWKQCLGASGTDSKVGVMLRGNPDQLGTETTGYVQGLMHGYLFIVYNTTGRSEFRVYRSSADLNLSMLVNSSVSTLIPANKQPVWYRASASGTSPVTLKLEYSTNGTTWSVGATTADTGESTFKSGATQLVWGLGAGNVNFFIDDITFSGVESDNGTEEDAITVSNTALTGFGYKQNSGPSASQSFTVSGNSLIETLIIDAPENYELSLDPFSGYTPSINLTHTNGSVAETTIYIRLKAGLNTNTYNGDIAVASVGAATKTVELSGIVDEDTNGVKPIINTFAKIISKEYYTLTGQRIPNKPTINGIYIVKNRMSDNTVSIVKESILRE